MYSIFSRGLDSTYREDVSLQSLLLLFKYANHRNNGNLCFAASEALVGTLMTIGDVNDISPISTRLTKPTFDITRPMLQLVLNALFLFVIQVHINLLFLESRLQAELLYALRAIMKYMT